MQLRVHGSGPSAPFLGARDLFETGYDLDRPVNVRIREDPDERTWAGHYGDRHVLNISLQAATSAMARELALHEFAHMHLYEQSHASHVQPVDEALFLALAGRPVERQVVSHGYQIANHTRDIYADDITLGVGPADKLVSYLESELAAAVADRPAVTPPIGGQRLTHGADPELTAVNAAFALGLVERHDLLSDDHRLYDLAHAAAQDAPTIDVTAFKRRFRSLADDPDESEYRRLLVGVFQEYADARDERVAAD